MIANDDLGWRVLRLDDGSSVVVDPDGRVIAVTEDGVGDPIESPTATSLDALEPITAGAASPLPTNVVADAPSVTDPSATAAETTSSSAVPTPAPAPAAPTPTASSVPALPPVPTVPSVATITVPTALQNAAALRFDTGTIGELATGLRGASDGIRAELERLDTTVAGLRGSWGGAAETAYRTAHREWDARLDALRQLLGDASKLATRVRDTMEGTESRVRSLWD